MHCRISKHATGESAQEAKLKETTNQEISQVHAVVTPGDKNLV